MNKLLLSALLVTGAIAQTAFSSTTSMPYEDQIAFIRDGFANTLAALSNVKLDDKPQYQEAINVLAEVKDILGIQTKSTTIVPTATKIKLMNAANRISNTLINLKEAANQQERIDIAKKAIKSLQANLKSLKTGVMDIYKTPTDLKNALHKATESFIETLKKWIGQHPELFEEIKESTGKISSAQLTELKAKELLEQEGSSTAPIFEEYQLTPYTPGTPN